MGDLDRHTSLIDTTAEDGGEEPKAYIHSRIAVPADFEAVFSHFYFAKNNSENSVTHTLLPSYQTIMIFGFGVNALLHTKQDSQIQLDKCLVLGPIKKAFDYTLPPGSEILVANFKDDAFFRFFGNASVAEHLPMQPDELLDENCFTSLWYELNKTTDNLSRMNRILDFCRPYLRPRNAVAEQLANFQNEHLNPIKSIAYENKQTERNIQHSHKKHLGYSAKELNRYQRFLKAIKMVQDIVSHDGAKADWFDIVNECGYYDQSQLIHDFKHYLNLSPTKYIKFQQDICDPSQ